MEDYDDSVLMKPCLCRHFSKCGYLSPHLLQTTIPLGGGGSHFRSVALTFLLQLNCPRFFANYIYPLNHVQRDENCEWSKTLHFFFKDVHLLRGTFVAIETMCVGQDSTQAKAQMIIQSKYLVDLLLKFLSKEKLSLFCDGAQQPITKGH